MPKRRHATKCKIKYLHCGFFFGWSYRLLSHCPDLRKYAIKACPAPQRFPSLRTAERDRAMHVHIILVETRKNQNPTLQKGRCGICSRACRQFAQPQSICLFFVKILNQNEDLKVLPILPMSKTLGTPPSRWTLILASQLVKLITCHLPN